MWTPTTLRHHSRRTSRYASDLTDTEWRLVEPYLPPPSRCGRPRARSMREIVNGIFCALRSGCPWRLIPSDLPPWSTLWRWFGLWRDDGLFERISHGLVAADREFRGREPCPSAPVVDSAYNSDRVANATSINIQIVSRIADQTGFVVHPRRWVVERTFAWLGRNRRLAKDFEATTASATAFLYAASAMLLTRRLARLE